MNSSQLRVGAENHQKTGTQYRKRGRTTSLLVAMALTLAACSSGTGSNASDPGSPSGEGGSAVKLDEAKAIVEEGMQVPEFVAPEPAVDVPALAGKSIFLVPLSSEVPFDQAILESMTAIADEANIDLTIFPTRGQPADWLRGVTQATTMRPDLLILLGAPDPDTLGPQLTEAQNAGIPVLVTHHYPIGVELPEYVTAHVPGPFLDAARLEVAYAIANSGGEANMVVVSADEYFVSSHIYEEMLATRDELCPECQMKKVNVPIPEWADKIQGEVQSALIADPSVNWVITMYDGMASFAQAAIISAGRTGQVQIATFNGTPSALKMVQDGDIVAMDVGENPDWLAHANMDQAFRILAGMETSEDVKTPVRIFDKSNIDETGTPPQLGQGYGTDYTDGYRKVWGLE